MTPAAKRSAAGRLIVAAALAAAGFTTARAQEVPEIPQVISPLRVETDHNGVNLVTGRMTMQVPTLSAPGAPNLRFDRVQNAAPYFSGRVNTAAPEGGISTASFSIHTGQGGSESFRCFDTECVSVTGTGSAFIQNVRRFRQAGSGAVWWFNNQHVDTPGPPRVQLYYATSVTWPNGEVISYQYDTDYLPDYPGRPYYRPTLLTSNLGYYITIAYQPGELGTIGWNSVSEAAIYREAGATDTLLGRLTYSGDTITQYGEQNQTSRTYICTGCSNRLGATVETFAGSLMLPGEAAPAVQAFEAPANDPELVRSEVVGTVIRDGVTWTYSYDGLGFTRSGGRVYDSLTVTGPNGFNQLYEFGQMDERNVLVSVTDSIGRRTGFTFDDAYRPTRIVSPELNAANVAYDPQGNIVSRTADAKPGSGLADIVETAQYPEPPQGLPNACNMLCWRPTSARDALNRQTDFAYNASGQLTERTDPADASGVRRRTIIEYETTSTGISRRNVVRVCGTGAACGTSAEIRTEYDYLGNTLLVTAERRIDAARGVTLTTTYAYDAAGRVLLVNGPLTGGGDTVYSRYDAFGRKIREVGPLGDNQMRLTQLHQYRAADDKVTRTDTAWVVNPDDAPTLLSWTEFAYDARRNPVREMLRATNSLGVTTTYAVLQRTFDLRNRLQCEARRMNPAQFAVSLLPESACDRDNVGTAPNDFGYDRITQNLYDAADQLLQERRGVDTPLLQTYARYTYTLNGRRASVTDANGNRAELRYDGLDRLSRWVFPSRTTDGAVNEADYESYGYDAVGNRTSLRKRDGSTLTYTYDALGRMTRKTVPEREGLAATHTRDVLYGYNVLDLQTFARFDTTGGEGVTNTYDALGRLLTSTTDMTGPARSVARVRDDVNNRIHLTYGGQTYRYDFDDAGGLQTFTRMTAPRPCSPGSPTIRAGRSTSATKGRAASTIATTGSAGSAP